MGTILTMTKENEYNYDREDIEVKTMTDEDYVYVVTKVNQEGIPHAEIPCGVYQEEEDALEAINDYQEDFEFAYGYRLILQ